MNIKQIKEFEKLADDYANEVCFDSKGNLIPELCWSEIVLTKFAELVRTDEREACANIALSMTTGSKVAWEIVDAIRARGEVK